MKNVLKITAVVIIIITAAAISTVTACAAVTDELLDALPESARKMLEKTDTDDPAGAISEIAGRAAGELKKSVAPIIKTGAAAVVICAVSSAASEFVSENEAMKKAVILAGAAGITVTVICGAGSPADISGETLSELYAFSAVLLPTVTSALAATGAAGTAAAALAASTLFMNFFISLSKKVIMPLIMAYIAASAASSAFGGGLKSAAKFLKWTVVTLLTAVSLAFTVYMSASGIMASAADAAAVKVTKTAISTLVPVVGKMVSDASESVASGFVIVKNTVGIFGALAVIAICALPILKLAATTLIFKGASALSEPFGGGGVSELVSDFGTAFGMAAASAGTSALMLFITIAAAVKTVGAV